MNSLRVLARLKPQMLCPGHGQTINNGAARIDWYIRHREEREEQVMAALAAGASTVEEVVTAVYPRNLRRNLRSAAARNVRTHLEKLVEDGRVAESSTAYSVRIVAFVAERRGPLLRQVHSDGCLQLDNRPETLTSGKKNGGPPSRWAADLRAGLTVALTGPDRRVWP